MLIALGTEPVTAGLAAVGARLATLWFSILLGFLAMLGLHVWRSTEKERHAGSFPALPLTPHGRA